MAVESTGYVYTTTDGGLTWTTQTSAGSRDWRAVASSSDGSIIVGLVYRGFMYVSTDSGSSWSERASAGSRYWSSIALTTDGIKIFASATANSLYYSDDSGLSWNTLTVGGYRSRRAIDMSDSGQSIAATVFTYSNAVYVSFDYGKSWSESVITQEWQYWASIAMSADGRKVIAGTENGSLYISNDSGQSWNAITGIHINDSDTAWFGLDMTPDGNTIVVSENQGADNQGGGLYISRDGGATWQEQTGVTGRYWSDMAFANTVSVSDDGQKIIVADSYGSEWNRSKQLHLFIAVMVGGVKRRVHAGWWG